MPPAHGFRPMQKKQAYIIRNPETDPRVRSRMCLHIQKRMPVRVRSCGIGHISSPVRLRAGPSGPANALAAQNAFGRFANIGTVRCLPPEPTRSFGSAAEDGGPWALSRFFGNGIGGKLRQTAIAPSPLAGRSLRGSTRQRRRHRKPRGLRTEKSRRRLVADHAAPSGAARAKTGQRERSITPSGALQPSPRFNGAEGRIHLRKGAIFSGSSHAKPPGDAGRGYVLGQSCAAVTHDVKPVSEFPLAPATRVLGMLRQAQRCQTAPC